MNVSKTTISHTATPIPTCPNLARLSTGQDMAVLRFAGGKQETGNIHTRFWVGLGQVLLWPFRKVWGLLQAGINWLKGNKQAGSLGSLSEKEELGQEQFQPDKASATKVFVATNAIMKQLSQVMSQVGDQEASEKITMMRRWLGQYHEYIHALPEGAETFRDVPPEVHRKYLQLIFDALSSEIDLLVNWGKSEARRLGYPEENIQKIILMGKVNKP